LFDLKTNNYFFNSTVIKPKILVELTTKSFGFVNIQPDIEPNLNFKHIVNLDRIKEKSSVNIIIGLSHDRNLQPKDLIKYGKD
jgi:hypothetical protein